VLIGVSYKVESCVAITVNNQTIELSGDPERVKPSVPTFFPKRGRVRGQHPRLRREPGTTG
jgi:hypothetical protein